LSNSLKFNNLIKSIKYLQKNGGLLIFLEREEQRNPYMKEYGIGAGILKDMGVKNINLLVGKKGVEFVGLSGFGLNIKKEIEIS
jgi:3,4-dihydroxy 2-butanone 4-phosphate synthase/GTP cyclohydrolase II